MERLTREIRQGRRVMSATGTQFSLDHEREQRHLRRRALDEVRQLPGHLLLLRRAMHAHRGESGRKRHAVAGVVVSGIGSTSTVFTYSPSAAAPSYIGVKLEFPAADGRRLDHPHGRRDAAKRACRRHEHGSPDAIRSQGGFTMIEVVVATLLLMLGLAGAS